jgi:oxygen-independent coproporphyrinogen-3 oxidase
VNPGTLTAHKAGLLRRAGVNRLSIGAQSFDDATLRRLGRIHTAAETRAGVELARDSGFENIGLDVIYGVPEVPRAAVVADVEAALALDPEHLSCYGLEIEAGTPLAREAQAGRIAVDEAEQRAQYDWIRGRLAEAGWAHYEISNFAKPGRECRQNLLYWTGGEYLGIGPAAHSHWHGVRWGNSAELPVWKREFEEQLDPAAKARETLVMGLRRIAGWGRAEFRGVTGFDYDALRGPEITRLAAAGMLVAAPERLRLAAEALFVSDAVFAELI